MKITTAAALLLLAAPALASRSFTTAELVQNPRLSIYPSPFYAHRDFGLQLPDYALNPKSPASIAAQAARPVAPAPAPVVPLLPQTALPIAPAYAAQAVEAMHARVPLSDEQRTAIAHIAQGAYEGSDVMTLAQLALLFDGAREKQLTGEIMDRLNVLRRRVNTKVSVEAGDAIKTVTKHSYEHLDDKARKFIADSLVGRLGA